jgi:hypothetical protein
MCCFSDAFFQFEVMIISRKAAMCAKSAPAKKIKYFFYLAGL